MTTYPSLNRAALDRNDVDSYSQLVSAPGPFMEFGEFIYLEATSTDASATLRISGKFLSPDGEIRAFTEDMTITGTGTQTAVTSRIGPCWLMGFSVRVVAGTITDGEIVASVHIARASASNPVHVMTLASGEVTNTRALGLGAFLAQSTTTVSSTQPTIVVATNAPAAGSNFSFTVTASQVWEIYSVRALLTNAATVATRTYSIVIDDGTNILLRHEAAVNQTASQVFGYSSNDLGAVWSPSATNTYVVPIPRIMLGAGSRIRSIVNTMQAGDQLSEVYLSYRLYT